MERRNSRKFGSVKFSLYETRTGSRRRRRLRTTFTEIQLEKLENQFQRNKYADPFTLETMSTKLNLDIDPIKVWFKNRRRREQAKLKQEKHSPSIKKSIHQSNKQCPSFNKQIGTFKGKQQNGENLSENVIKTKENFNTNDKVKITNVSSSTINGYLIASGDSEKNNSNNNRNNNNEHIKVIYTEHDLYALYNNNNQHNKEVVNPFATIYSNFGPPIFNGSYMNGVNTSYLNTPYFSSPFFSSYFSANNLQELAWLIN